MSRVEDTEAWAWLDEQAAIAGDEWSFDDALDHPHGCAGVHVGACHVAMPGAHLAEYDRVRGFREVVTERWAAELPRDFLRGAARHQWRTR
ncbi:MAG: hypothetical protein ACOX52_16080 [Verrucomicrobiota bacterium]